MVKLTAVGLRNYIDKTRARRDAREQAIMDIYSKTGGIGLTANQIGMRLNMMVIGGHPSIENGMKLTCFNPVIISI